MPSVQREEDFIYFKTEGGRDPDYLRNVHVAHFRFKKLRSAPRLAMTLVVVLSGVVLLTSERIHSCAVQSWTVSMIATGVLAALELRWYRRRERLMRENQ